MSVRELQELGLRPMEGDEVDGFLSNQGVGVLVLPDDDVPYAVPLSFGYDGESRLYFTYLLGTDSRKETLSQRTDRARFLVYSVDTPFHWESVILTGSLDAIPREAWDEHEAILDNAWRPALLEQADLSRGIAVYRFLIEERVGFRHAGLPPGLTDRRDRESD